MVLCLETQTVTFMPFHSDETSQHSWQPHVIVSKRYMNPLHCRVTEFTWFRPRKRLGWHSLGQKRPNTAPYSYTYFHHRNLTSMLSFPLFPERERRKSSNCNPGKKCFNWDVYVSVCGIEFFKNTQSWQCWHCCQLCILIHIVSSLLYL